MQVAAVPRSDGHPITISEYGATSEAQHSCRGEFAHRLELASR